MTLITLSDSDNEENGEIDITSFDDTASSKDAEHSMEIDTKFTRGPPILTKFVASKPVSEVMK